MKTHLVAALFVLCATAGASASPSTNAPAALSEILGIRLDMPRDAVRTTLASVATFEREERRRHEVWTLTDDPRYASLIIGYTPKWNVRFVTAVAKPGGTAVHYDQVLDVKHADHRAAGQTHTYTWKTGTPPYYVIAIGKPDRIEYLSLKREPQ